MEQIEDKYNQTKSSKNLMGATFGAAFVVALNVCL
jgi:hypothetical protein